MIFMYKGMTTHKLYLYAWPQSEAADGTISVNGETAMTVNVDGSIARGVAGPSPDIYGPGASFSPWEEHA